MCFSPIYPPLSFPNFFSHHKTWPSRGPKKHHWFPTKDTWRSGRTPNYHGEGNVLVSSEQGFHCVSLDTLPCFKRWDFSGKSHRPCGGSEQDGTGRGREWGGQAACIWPHHPAEGHRFWTGGRTRGRQRGIGSGQVAVPAPAEDQLPVVCQSLAWSGASLSPHALPSHSSSWRPLHPHPGFRTLPTPPRGREECEQLAPPLTQKGLNNSNLNGQVGQQLQRNLWHNMHVYMLSHSSHLTLCEPMDRSPLCPWNSPGKNTGVGCHALLQGIFPTQG